MLSYLKYKARGQVSDLPAWVLGLPLCASQYSVYTARICCTQQQTPHILTLDFDIAYAI